MGFGPTTDCSLEGVALPTDLKITAGRGPTHHAALLSFMSPTIPTTVMMCLGTEKPTCFLLYFLPTVSTAGGGKNSRGYKPVTEGGAGFGTNCASISG